MKEIETVKSMDGKAVTHKYEIEDLYPHPRARVATFMGHLLAHAEGVTVVKFLGQRVDYAKKTIKDVIELKSDSNSIDVVLGDPSFLDAMFYLYDLNAWTMDFRYEGEANRVLYYMIEGKKPVLDISCPANNKANLLKLVKAIRDSSYFYHEYDRNLVKRLRMEFGIPSEKAAVEAIQDLEKHTDISDEFLSCLEYGDFEFPDENLVEVEGYTAPKLKAVVGDKLNNLGVYQYLIYLRENPAEALENLKKGLPRR